MHTMTNAFSKKWESHWASMSLWYTLHSVAGYARYGSKDCGSRVGSVTIAGVKPTDVTITKDKRRP